MNERLLTDEECAETFQHEVSVKGGGFWQPDKLCEAQDVKTANYYQSVVIPAERAAAREELIKEIEKFIDNNYMVIGGNHENWKSLVRWQQLKGGQ